MLCKSVRIENRSVRMFYPRPSHHFVACLQVVFRQIPKDERPRKGRVAIIHKKIQCGLHRFTEVGNIDKHWKTFANLLAKKPTFKTYLDDKGVGKEPNTYLIAVERSLRQFGEDRFAMGTFAMDSKSEWHNKKLVWKKIECYIAFVRHFKGHDSYGKYQHFYWEDGRLFVAQCFEGDVYQTAFRLF